MQATEDSESEEDVFMDAPSSARTRRRDFLPSIAHETIPLPSIHPSSYCHAPSTPPNYRASYASAAAPPPLSASPLDTYAPPPTTATPSSSLHPSYPIDCLDFTRTRSAHFIVEKTCEMICYLWSSSPPADAVGSEDDDAMMKKGAGKEEVSLTSPMKSAFSSSNPPCCETSVLLHIAPILPTIAHYAYLCLIHAEAVGNDAGVAECYCAVIAFYLSAQGAESVYPSAEGERFSHWSCWG